MHCNLRSPDAMPVFFRFNYDAMSGLRSLLWYYSFFAAIALRCDLDLEHLQCIACDVMKLCTIFCTF